MEGLREFAATLIFSTGVAFTFTVIGTFHWLGLIGCISCFVLAYFIWPSRRRGYRENGSRFIDVLEIFIEFPVDVFMWVFRLFGRIFFNKNGDLDVDIDL